MDTKVKLHKEVVCQLIEEIGALLPLEEGGVENQIIVDNKNGHYLLFGVGWEGSKWFYASFLHIDVKANGKVWIQHNGIDLPIVEKLEDKGLLKSDIILGYQPQSVRQYTGYAIV